jgi:hypothetical protein
MFNAKELKKSRIYFYLSRSLILPGLSLCSAVCYAQMYKCVDANGNSVFADKPCGPDAQVHVVHVQPPSAGFSGSVSNMQIGPSYVSPDTPAFSTYSPTPRTYVARTNEVRVVVERPKNTASAQRVQHSEK